MASVAPKMSFNVVLWGLLVTFQSGNRTLLKDVHKTKEDAARTANFLRRSPEIKRVRVTQLAVTPLRVKRPIRKEKKP